MRQYEFYTNTNWFVGEKGALQPLRHYPSEHPDSGGHGERVASMLCSPLPFHHTPAVLSCQAFYYLSTERKGEPLLSIYV